jgi:hypothetical protein
MAGGSSDFVDRWRQHREWADDRFLFGFGYGSQSTFTFGGPLLASYWYLWVPPGLAITLLCAAFYLVGRGLDEVVNPRLRRL